MSTVKYVCARCGCPCGWWAKGDGGYWKHQNGGWKAKKTCGKPALAMRASEVQFSPAMRNALRDVRVGLSRGWTLDESIYHVCRATGYMQHEVHKAYRLSENNLA